MTAPADDRPSRAAPNTAAAWAALREGLEEARRASGSYTASDMAAANIRLMRQAREWTAAELAERCARLGGEGAKLTAAVIANIELGRRGKDGNRRRDITINELLILAEALSAAPSVLCPLLWVPTGGQPDPEPA